MHCSNCLPSSGGSPERQPTAIRRYGSHAFKQSPNGSLQTAADAMRVTCVRGTSLERTRRAATRRTAEAAARSAVVAVGVSNARRRQ